MAKDFGTGVNPKGLTVGLVECETCGSVYARGAAGHEIPPQGTSTDQHKGLIKGSKA